MWTTVDLDPLVLAELERRRHAEGKTLGEVVSELLAPALRAAVTAPADVAWRTRALHALVDIDDQDAVRAAMGAP